QLRIVSLSLHDALPISGHPFQTPSLLGQVVLFGDSTPTTSHLVFGAILVYTAFHFAVFALLGMGLVVLVHWGVRDPVVRYALLRSEEHTSELQSRFDVV